MKRLVEITREEYVALGDAGVWVWGSYARDLDEEEILRLPSDHLNNWSAQLTRRFTHFWTKVSGDGTVS